MSGVLPGVNAVAKRYIFLCEVPLDERNGAGVRVALAYLRRLGGEWLSVHTGLTAHTGQGVPAHTRYAQVPAAKGMVGAWRLFVGAWRHLRGERGTAEFALLLPNSVSDLLLGLVAYLCGLPVATWWMDDVEARLGTEAGSLRRSFYRGLCALVYRVSWRRIAVAPSLQAALAQRYGAPCEAVVGKSRSSVQTTKTRASGPLRLVYLGLYQGFYREGLEALSRVLRDDAQAPFSVDFWGQVPPPAELLVPGRFVYRGELPEADLPATLNRYDAGIITYSFDSLTLNMMRYSFPSKLVDYVAAALPVFSIVPKSLAISAELQRRYLGPVLHNTEASRVGASIREWAAGTHDFARASECALAWAQSDFEPEANWQKFRSSLA